MKKVFILFFIFVFGASLTVVSQNLKVTGFKKRTTDLSAVRFEKKDINGVPCGLIKVWLPVSEGIFSGNVVESAFKNGEWWVYMTKGSKRVSIKTSQYPPLTYEFDEPILGDVTYVMTVERANEENRVHILPRIKVSYYKKGEWDDDRLFAKVEGLEYNIDLSNESDNPDDNNFRCFSVVEQEDFDGNGTTDALIEEIAGCGNMGLLVYYIVSYSTNGYYTVSNSIWGNGYTIEDWRGKKSILIIDANLGYENDKMNTKKERYVLKDGKMEMVETLKKQLIVSFKELRSSDFHHEDEKPLRLSYDLDGNGTTDYFECFYWSRWGSMIINKFVLNGKEVEDDCFNVGIKRIGVLSSTTNGYHDLVMDENSIIKWDGEKYVFPKRQFDW